MRTHKRIFCTVFFCWLLVCHVVSPTVVSGQGQEKRVVIPFDLQGSPGLGPEDVYRKLILRDASQPKVVSWVLIQSLQSLQLSLIDVGPGGPDALVANRWYKTGEPVEVNKDLVIAHNNAYPNLKPLRTDVRYGVGYEVKYTLQDRQIILGFRTFLYSRGSGAKFRRYGGTYSGEFFAGPLYRGVHERLETLRILQAPVIY